MIRGKSLFAAIVLFVIGFSFGFALRPVILPPPKAAVPAVTSSTTSVGNEPRGVQYFEVNIDEARRVVAACREGIVRGDECSNAETAIATVESRDRFRRFRKDR